MIKQISLKSTLFTIAIAAMFFSSCEKDDNPELLIKYKNGVFITNEGSFGGNNGSVSFYSYVEDSANGTKADTVYNDIFYKVNKRNLGDVVQSITVIDSLAFIVVNNSNKIEVVTSDYFKEVRVIEGINQPRYLVANGNKAYISAWGDGGVVYVVDLTSFSVISTIKAGNGPEKMLIDGNKLYVANGGGLANDSTISIIDLETDQKVDSIIVGGNPKAIVKDKDGYKWILCYGIVNYDPVNYSIIRETPSVLTKLNNNDEVIATLIISETEHPWAFDINQAGDKLYFGGGYSYQGIKSFSVSASEGNYDEVVSDIAYSFMIEPNTGEIFVYLTPSFTENGTLKRFSNEGTFINSYTLGIGPNGGVSSKCATSK
jgi:YVTN family beta-propeller protein